MGVLSAGYRAPKHKEVAMPSQRSENFGKLQQLVQTKIETAETEVGVLEEGISRLAQERGALEDIDETRRPFCLKMQKALEDLQADARAIHWKVRRARGLLQEAIRTRSFQKLAAANHALRCGL